ncbi:MAG: DUF4176 domain-containing protein [Lachnospiraceae bacterium]|nr:DUF4176 domain-containing protein [Lachnospiraceae bacterium]
MNTERDILPIGSVVLLKDAKKKIMIIGFMALDMAKKDKVFDYMGVVYPEGFLGKGSACMFNQDKIEEVCFRGYENEENEEFRKIVQQVYNAADQLVSQGNQESERK